ncbi:hypothetical protein JTB14_034275 [Gonioctena quinquepunctata]|nr:hypothetical protein JTB14_034275 [Gonioctena quinquepunctata]
MKYVLEDPSKMGDSQQYLLLSLLLLWKLILSQSERIREHILKVFSWELEITKNDEINRINVENTRYNHTVFFFLAIMYFSICCQFMFNGYTMWIYMSSHTQMDKSLIFTGWFPFDPEKHFGMAYFFQLFNGFFVGAYSLAFDSLIISLIIFATMRLRILAYKFKNFGAGKSLNSMQILKNHILEHQEIISYRIHDVTNVTGTTIEEAGPEESTEGVENPVEICNELEEFQRITLEDPILKQPTDDISRKMYPGRNRHKREFSDHVLYDIICFENTACEPDNFYGALSYDNKKHWKDAIKK